MFRPHSSPRALGFAFTLRGTKTFVWGHLRSFSKLRKLSTPRRVKWNKKSVVIEWEDNVLSILHNLWLLDNDPNNREKTTTQKIRNSTDMSATLSVDNALILESKDIDNSSSIQITWSDETISIFEGAWLRATTVPDNSSNSICVGECESHSSQSQSFSVKSNAASEAAEEFKTLRSCDAIPTIPFEDVMRTDTVGEAAVFEWTKACGIN